MLGRVKHNAFGTGVALSEDVTQGGKRVSVVLFDFAPTGERTIADSFLATSRCPNLPRYQHPRSPPQAPSKESRGNPRRTARWPSPNDRDST